MTSTTTKLAEFDLGQGLTLIQQRRDYIYCGSAYAYLDHDLEGLTGEDIEQLAKLAAVLKNLPEDGALDFNRDELESYLKDWAAECAEYAELPFTYTTDDGDTNTYTPASLWESSGGCEWEQSAQIGYDYGWNV